ncbi:hypothetical protein V9T40_010787 [Parthenolecanium corni]|uniref:Uncharacterized protein n=1 Tax=Parthenolecanium corni TaxID=536013 RepID=A0AAN9XXI3_9HEMI
MYAHFCHHMPLARPPRGAEAVACTIVHVTEGESRRPPKTGTQQQPQQPRGYPSMATAAHVLHRRPHFTYQLVGIECALDDAAVPVSNTSRKLGIPLLKPGPAFKKKKKKERPVPLEIQDILSETRWAPWYTAPETTPTEQLSLSAQNMTLDNVTNASTGATGSGVTQQTVQQTVQQPVQIIHHIPMPQFDQKDPDLWLRMVEARLDGYGIPENLYYKRVRIDMPKAIAQRLPALLAPAAANDNWTYFKEKVIQAFGRTRQDEIAELLDKVTLEGRTPVEVMDYMIKLAGTEIGPSVVASRFLKLFAKDIVTGVKLMRLDLKANDEKGLRELADAVQYAFSNSSTPTKVGAVSAVSGDTRKPASDLEVKIDKILNRLTNLESRVNNMSQGKQASGSRGEAAPEDRAKIGSKILETRTGAGASPTQGKSNLAISLDYAPSIRGSGIKPPGVQYLARGMAK